jgi:hypothetical protein
MDKCFRCGWCGQSTDKDGRVLSRNEVRAIDPESKAFHNAEQTHGDCCINEQENRRVQVTREMAMDAGEPEMEGAWIDW